MFISQSLRVFVMAAQMACLVVPIASVDGWSCFGCRSRVQTFRGAFEEQKQGDAQRE